jgi:hypothetical protein
MLVIRIFKAEIASAIGGRVHQPLGAAQNDGLFDGVRR